jgi:thiol-disulfide isomerase/thioredoxin
MRRWILLLGLVALPAWGGEGVALIGPDGSEARLQPSQGELLLLHFWATWCPTCAEDLGNLERAAAACPEAPLRVIAVNVGEGDADVAEFVEKHGVRLPILRDPKGRVWREIDGRGLPMNLFWTRETRHTDVGPKTVEEWRSQLAPHGCAEDPDDLRDERRGPDQAPIT